MSISKKIVQIKVIKIVILIWKDDNKKRYFFTITYTDIRMIKLIRCVPIEFNKKISNKTP